MKCFLICSKNALVVFLSLQLTNLWTICTSGRNYEIISLVTDFFLHNYHHHYIPMPHDNYHNTTTTTTTTITKAFHHYHHNSSPPSLKQFTTTTVHHHHQHHHHHGSIHAHTLTLPPASMPDGQSCYIVHHSP